MTIKVKSTNPPYQNYHHFHASSKYRASVFTKAMAERLEILIQEKCQERGWKFTGLAVDDDHIHFLIQANTTYSDIAQRIFGYTSIMLRREFPKLKELNKDHLWGGTQYVPINDQKHLESVINYINEHKVTDLR